MIPINDAHLVLGLEPLETLRNLRFISEQTVVIINTHCLFPRNVIIGSEKGKEYPSIGKIIDILDQIARRTISMDFNKLSEVEFKDSLYANTIILGVGAREYQDIFDKKLMIQFLSEFFGESDKNIEAFKLGYRLVNP